jgi:tetratricopeptide (TPR) repeat protein
MTAFPSDGDRIDASILKAAKRDFTKAMALATNARAEGIRTPNVHYFAALELKDGGRVEDAILELGLALELEPRNSRLMTTVGFYLLELDRGAEAARVFETAMKLDPRSADAAFGYGWAAERLGALDSARSAYDQAIALDPDHADALAGLSGLEARRRVWGPARTHADRAVQLNPKQTDALTHLARIDIGEGDFEAAERRLADLIALPILKPVARANARILLGDALDGSKHFERAFDAYADGKRELSELYAGDFAREGEQSATLVIDEMRKEFEETPVDSWAAPASGKRAKATHEHAFLMGFPRSGTTLLEQVLATHPEIVAAGEKPLLRDAEVEFIRGSGDMSRLSSIMSDTLEPYRTSYWRRAAEFGFDPRGKAFVDKHPLATFQLPLIQKMFPEAKIIFSIRDPRDVVLSCFRRPFNMNPSTYEFTSLDRAARLYDAVMTASAVYMNRLPLKVHQIRHEDLVADFDGSSRSLCEFLDVDWTDELKGFAQTTRAIATPSSAQVARGLYEEGVGHWRNYAFALEPVLPILRPWISEFGYAPK